MNIEITITNRPIKTNYSKHSKYEFKADLKVSIFGVSGNTLCGREFHILTVLGMYEER